MPDTWFPLSIGFCPTQETWDKLMAKCRIDEWPYPERGQDPLAGAHCNTFAGPSEYYSPFAVITLNDRAEKDREPIVVMGLIAHEVIHVFQFLCERIGENHPSAEFQAYSHQAIFQFMVQEFDRTRWEPHHGRSIFAPPKADRATPSKVGPGDSKGVSRQRRSGGE